MILSIRWPFLYWSFKTALGLPKRAAEDRVLRNAIAWRRHISSDFTRSTIPNVEGASIQIQTSARMARWVSRFIRSFWSKYRDRLDAAPLQRITMAILDLLGSAYSLPEARSEFSSTLAVWRVRIKEHIEAHLDNSQLTPGHPCKAYSEPPAGRMRGSLD
jgi:hypothetical protein